MPPAPLLTLKNIALGFGRQELLDDVELTVGEGERLTLVGRNGSGKSTLLKIMAGEVEADHGERSDPPGRDAALSAAGAGPLRLRDDARLCGGRASRRATTATARPICSARSGLSGDEDPAHLSGGEARRAALARALAPNPDILILDEPTNHLDLPAIEWLEEEIARSRSAIVLVSHDRRLLERAVARDALARPRHGAPARSRLRAFEEWRDEVFAQEERDRQKLDRKIAAELDWVRYGVTARRTRNQGRLRALARAAAQAPRTAPRRRQRQVHGRRCEGAPASW